MKAIRIHNHGDVDALKYEEINEPFKVFLIDKLGQKRNEYIVYPNKKI